jgi:Calx-beta domain/FG-GAP-like repeat
MTTQFTLRQLVQMAAADNIVGFNPNASSFRFFDSSGAGYFLVDGVVPSNAGDPNGFVVPASQLDTAFFVQADARADHVYVWANTPGALAVPLVIGANTQPPPTGQGTVIGIVAADADHNEGHVGATLFTFTVSRSGITNGTHSVTWTVSSGAAPGADTADFVGGRFQRGTVTFGPNETSRTVTVQVQGDTVVEGDDNFVVTLSNPTNGASIDPLHPSANGRIRNDDGVSPPTVSLPDDDILWRHDSGAVMTWEMEDGGLVQNHMLPHASLNWQIAGLGDFEGDGDVDVLWHHRDGAVVTWEMENGAYRTNHNLPFASAGWEIVNTGDFDGDGDSDVLWRHRDGAVVTWEMEGGAYVRNHRIELASAAWRIDGVGDFDADGDSDILWRHRDGAVVTWEMEDGAYVRNHNIEVASTSWSIQGAGDFDADGDDDILWRHQNGAVVSWEMEGGRYVRNHNIALLPTSLQFQGIGDFNADLDDDILWRNSDGGVMNWQMEDGSVLGTVIHGRLPATWQIARVGDFDLT